MLNKMMKAAHEVEEKKEQIEDIKENYGTAIEVGEHAKEIYDKKQEANAAKSVGSATGSVAGSAMKGVEGMVPEFKGTTGTILTP